MSYKDLNQTQDITSQLSVINEVIPLTGAFFSSSFYTKTYINITSGSSVSGGFYQTVYDGAPTATSASALCDLAYGHSSASLLAARSETFLNSEKQRVYREMAKLLLGNENNFFTFNNVTYHELFFVMPKRRIYKDEMQKGNFSINLQITGSSADTLNLTDAGAASSYIVGPAGDEAPLFSASTQIGRVYYNAGIVCFNTGVFIPKASSISGTYWSGSVYPVNLAAVAITGNFDCIINGFKNRINQINFNNQTNLHSTIYFCRALNNEFNYSSNPTFVDSDGRIIPTSGTDNQTRTYITTIGLYDINNNLLACAKLSEPVKKSPDSEITIRCRLSY